MAMLGSNSDSVPQWIQDAFALAKKKDPKAFETMDLHTFQEQTLRKLETRNSSDQGMLASPPRPPMFR